MSNPAPGPVLLNDAQLERAAQLYCNLKGWDPQETIAQNAPVGPDGFQVGECRMVARWQVVRDHLREADLIHHALETVRLNPDLETKIGTRMMQLADSLEGSFSGMPHFTVKPPVGLPSIHTPPGRSVFSITVPLLVDGQMPRSGGSPPNLVIEGRSYEEAMALFVLVHKYFPSASLT